MTVKLVKQLISLKSKTVDIYLVFTICLIAISRDFFEIVLPNPVASAEVVDVFTGFLIAESGTWEPFRASASVGCPFPCRRPLPVGSESLPLVTMGDECLLVLVAAVVSEFPFIDIAAPGLDLPAETGLSGGKVVLRFGGVSRGKSGGTIG